MSSRGLHFHVSPSCIGQGNGNPLQCSCLENPRDGGAWWAAVYGVAQSRTRQKRLSSSSSSSRTIVHLVCPDSVSLHALACEQPFCLSLSRRFCPEVPSSGCVSPPCCIHSDATHRTLHASCTFPSISHLL